MVNIFRLVKQSELASIWKCSQQNVSYKLKHQAVTIAELRLLIRKHPELKQILLTYFD